MAVKSKPKKGYGKAMDPEMIRRILAMLMAQKAGGGGGVPMPGGAGMPMPQGGGAPMPEGEGIPMPMGR